MKPALDQQITLTIKRLGIHGEGIGDWNGFTIFVDGALPTENVTVSIDEVRKNFARARVVQYHEKSPHRVTPPCPVFGRCGGCQLMHLGYSHQLETKQQRVIDALERIGKLFNIPVAPCIPSPQPLAYRNKIQLPVDSSHRIGLYAFNSHDLIEIDRCYIHCSLGEEAFHLVRRMVQSSPEAFQSLRHVLIKTAIQTGQVLVIFVTEGEGSPALTNLAQQLISSMPPIKGVVQNIHTAPDNVILGKTYRTLAGQPFIEDRICGLTFKVSPASFFQVNPEQAENLYLKAIEFCALQGHETILDAYCGVGTLSLLLAPHVQKIIGVECVAPAISDAEENASRNNIKNASFTCAQVEDFIGTLTALDVAVLNPPRKGCDPLFLEKLSLLKPRRIVYISCDPATLARDLKLLHERGYTIDAVQPFDMFPQTVHVECLVVLNKSF